MATIMTETHGGVTRRCDASCHRARKPRCVCICGGRYHGAGSSAQAQQKLTKDIVGSEWEGTLGQMSLDALTG